MKRYTFLLLDADNTLLDFSETERLAISAALARFGCVPTAENAALYSAINRKYWRLHDLGELTQAQVQLLRFEELFARLGLQADPAAAETVYRAELGRCGRAFPGTAALCRDLGARYRLLLVTNGVPETQYQRLHDTGLDVYFEQIFISGQVGAHKPQKAFFDYVAAHTPGFDREKALIVGDGLTSDIQGGVNAGIDTCFFDRKYTGPGAARPTYIVHSYDELRKLLLT